MIIIYVNYYYHSDPVDSKLFFSIKRTIVTIINEPDSDINDYYHHYN